MIKILVIFWNYFGIFTFKGINLPQFLIQNTNDYFLHLFYNIKMNLDITGLDKVKLLKALWEKQITASFFGGLGPQWSDKNAAKAVIGYIDYYQGRAIKTDLSGDEVDPWLYDRDAGKGTFAEIVKQMRKIMEGGNL